MYQNLFLPGKNGYGEDALLIPDCHMGKIYRGVDLKPDVTPFCAFHCTALKANYENCVPKANQKIPCVDQYLAWAECIERCVNI